MSSGNEVPQPTASAANPLRPPTAPLLTAPQGALLLALLVLLAYFPSIDGGFIWDDNTYVIKNPHVVAPGGLLRIWTSAGQVEYYPVSYSMFWLEWRLWGANPLGYHVTNLVLHICAALLIWLLLRKLRIVGAYLAAVLFAVHPVNVEAVAWIFQGRGLLALALFLTSMLWYLRDEDAPVGAGDIGAAARGFGLWYWLSLLAFLLAMLSKGSVAIAPLVLLGLAWWRHGRIAKTDWLRAAPFLAIAVVLASASVWFQTRGTGEIIRSASFADRLAGAGGVVWFYLGKAILPIQLIFIYPQWNIQPGNALWWAPLAAAALLTAVLWSKRRRGWGRPLAFAWGSFCVALLPTAGFVDVYFMKYSLVADHYLQIGLIAVVALAAAIIALGIARLSPNSRWLGHVGCLALVGISVGLSWRQSRTYSDIVTLYRSTIDRNPACWMAYNNLGLEMLTDGQTQQALEYFQQAVRINPEFPEVHINWGDALYRSGHLPEAIDHYREAMRLAPNYAEAYNNLGVTLLASGQTAEAIEQLEHALQIRHDYADAENNLGNAMLVAGRVQEAAEHYLQAARLRPGYAEACYNLANALRQLGQTEDAIDAYRHAIKFKPDVAEFYNNLATALMDAGQDQEASENLLKALSLNPNYPNANYNLGLLLYRAGYSREATIYFQEAVRLKPDYTAAYLGLAVAYDQTNHLGEAIVSALMGLNVARAQGQTAMVEQFQKWLNSLNSAP